jgi:hypothetical protein
MNKMDVRDRQANQVHSSELEDHVLASHSTELVPTALRCQDLIDKQLLLFTIEVDLIVVVSERSLNKVLRASERCNSQ